MDIQAIDDFKALSTKHYLQFVEDAKDHPRLPEAHSSFMSVMSLAHFIFNISIEFLKIKKEDRAGAEVAAETITTLESSQFQELPAFIELV